MIISISIPYNKSAAKENHRATYLFSNMKHPKTVFLQSPETGTYRIEVWGQDSNTSTTGVAGGLGT